MRHRRLLITASLSLACLLPGAALAGGSASAPSSGQTLTSTPTTVDTSELLDLSHQAADIQKKVEQLLAQGRMGRSGKLSLLATCGFPDPTQAFLPWADPAQYSLAANGDLDGWSLKKAVVDDLHDPWSPGDSALTLAGDAEATSPVMCVNLANPTIRLFLRDNGGSGKSDLKVSVMYESTDGSIKRLDLAKLRAGSSWQPSITIPIVANLLSAASASGVTPVAFVFHPEGLQKGETISIDGLYVDPFASR